MICVQAGGRLNKRNRLDYISIWIAGACAVHCILIPLLVPLSLAFASSIFAEHWFERVVLVSSLAVGGVAILYSIIAHHGKWWPFLLLSVGGVIYWQKDIFGHEYEWLAVALGAFTIIAAHLFNRQLCLAEHCCAEHSSGRQSKVSTTIRESNA